jgi:lipoate-protein ligase A
LTGRQISPGGTITTYLRLEGPAQNRIRAALFTGDFFITPPRVIYDLESALRGVYLDDLAGVIHAFFEETEVAVLSVSADDFIASVQEALAER